MPNVNHAGRAYEGKLGERRMRCPTGSEVLQGADDATVE
jgi:hypothetical protein